MGRIAKVRRARSNPQAFMETDAQGKRSVMSFIDIKNLVFKYKTYISEKESTEHTAIDNLTLSVEKGNFIGILGHNGSGKSTLAKQLVSLLFPTSGTIIMKGIDTSDERNILKIRQTAGIVFQNPDNQFVANVVEEDVAFGPENLGISEKEMHNRVENALRVTGIEGYRLMSPNHLSGGQKQRVAISGILAMEPECIILDEPTAMLDPAGRREVLEAIRYLNKEKKITIIYITHHVEEVEQADYLYVMNHGKIALEGKTADVLSDEQLKTAGLEYPFFYKLKACLEDEGITIEDEICNEEELMTYIIKRMEQANGNRSYS